MTCQAADVQPSWVSTHGPATPRPRSYSMSGAIGLTAVNEGRIWAPVWCPRGSGTVIGACAPAKSWRSAPRVVWSPGMERMLFIIQSFRGATWLGGADRSCGMPMREATGVPANHTPDDAVMLMGLSSNQLRHCRSKAAVWKRAPTDGRRTTSIGAPSSLKAVQPAGRRSAAAWRYARSSLRESSAAAYIGSPRTGLERALRATRS